MSTVSPRHKLEAWLGDGRAPEQADRIIADYQSWERSVDRDNFLDDNQNYARAVLLAIAEHHDGTLDPRKALADMFEARRVLDAALEVQELLRGSREQHPPDCAAHG